MDQIKFTLNIMHVKGKEALELATYILNGVAILLYEAWKKSRGLDVILATWKEFKKASLTIIFHLRSEKPVWINS